MCGMEFIEVCGQFAKAKGMRVLDSRGQFGGVPGIVAMDGDGTLRFIEAREQGEKAADDAEAAGAAALWLAEWGVDGFVETDVAIDLVRFLVLCGAPMLNYKAAAHAA